MKLRRAGVAGAGVVLLGATLATLYARDDDDIPSFRAQACSLPREWLERTRRGGYEPRSGQISLLPKTPAYMASGGQGWSHSGPWPYLRDVPLVAYGPGIVPAGGEVDRPVTLADLAPTTAALIGFDEFPPVSGTPLREVVRRGRRARLVVTIVWDGGGWNTLDQWPGDWPNLKRMMEGGISYTRATVGSSPSVTPAVHSTMGTGVFPKNHGITGVPVRTNEWKTNPNHYEIPDSVLETGGLDDDIRALDAEDGRIDGAWGDLEILEIRDRLEELPAVRAFSRPRAQGDDRR